METSSDAQSESDIYDDVGIPGLRLNAYKQKLNPFPSPVDMSCESQSESDSHNYEEITEDVRNIIPHNYEEIDEFSSDDDYYDYDEYCLERSIGALTPELDDVEFCEPAEQQQVNSGNGVLVYNGNFNIRTVDKWKQFLTLPYNNIISSNLN
jgi:hypothetical protein